MNVTTAAALRAEAPDIAALLDLVPGWDPWAQMEAGWYFTIAGARAAVEWFPENLLLVKGPKAGKPFVLEPFQAAIIATLFGFRRANGTRRFRRAWLYVGKKNAKSSLAAGIVLLIMSTDGEQGAENYSAAAAQKQAGHVFDHAAGFVLKNPKLNKAKGGRFRVYGHKGGSVSKLIADEDTLSFYKCLASDADTADGANPHLSIIDEFHRHKNGALADILLRSSRTRSQPLTIWTTTADHNRESACNTMLKFARAVRDNGGDDGQPGYAPDFAPFIWEAAKDDDWESVEAWRKANPGLGTIKPMEAMEAACQDAKDMPSTLNSFLRLELNIVTDTADAWLDMAKWDACEPERTVAEVAAHLEELEAELEGEVCYAGLDLSRTRDQTAVPLWFPERRVVLCRFWIPKDRAVAEEKLHGIPYSLWARHGLITLVPGGVIEYGMIDAEIQRLGQRFKIQELGYDPWKAERLRQTLVADELEAEMISMRQGAQTLGEATTELERLVLAGELRHGGHPVLRQNALNAAVREDKNLNIIPCKKTSDGPIDGIMALVMAIAGAILSPPGPSLDDILSEEILEV